MECTAPFSAMLSRAVPLFFNRLAPCPVSQFQDMFLWLESDVQVLPMSWIMCVVTPVSTIGPQSGGLTVTYLEHTNIHVLLPQHQTFASCHPSFSVCTCHLGVLHRTFAKSAPLLIRTCPSHMPFDNEIVGCFFDFHDTVVAFSVRREQYPIVLSPALRSDAHSASPAIHRKLEHFFAFLVAYLKYVSHPVLLFWL